jgi:hypothetical protein
VSASRNPAWGAAVLALCAAILAAPVIADASAGKRRTYFTNDCASSRYRPHHLIATCGDGSIRVKKIQWTHYGPRRADGHGIAITNTCVPNCVNGHISQDAAEVHLSRPRLCRNVGRYQFTHLKFVYVGETPPIPERSQRFPFPCSMLSG